MRETILTMSEFGSITRAGRPVWLTWMPSTTSYWGLGSIKQVSVSMNTKFKIWINILDYRWLWPWVGWGWWNLQPSKVWNQAHQPPHELHRHTVWQGVAVSCQIQNSSKTKFCSRRQVGKSLLHAICVIFAMSFVPASFVVFHIEVVFMLTWEQWNTMEKCSGENKCSEASSLRLWSLAPDLLGCSSGLGPHSLQVSLLGLSLFELWVSNLSYVSAFLRVFASQYFWCLEPRPTSPRLTSAPWCCWWWCTAGPQCPSCIPSPTSSPSPAQPLWLCPASIYS